MKLRLPKKRNTTLKFVLEGREEPLFTLSLPRHTFTKLVSSAVFLLTVVSLMILFEVDSLFAIRDEPSVKEGERSALLYEEEIPRLFYNLELLKRRQDQIHRELVGDDYAKGVILQGLLSEEEPVLAEEEGSERDPFPIPRKLHSLRTGVESRVVSNREFLEFYDGAFRFIPHRWPLQTGRIRITSSYGYRSDPFFGGSRSKDFHKGLDLKASTGVPVKATADGVVLRVDYASKGYGRMIKVKHPSGFVTLYAHLNTIYVLKNQVVKAGQVIGRSGNSGYSTGPHLHYEIQRGGRTVDPLLYLAP